MFEKLYATRGEYTSIHREWYQDWSYEGCVVVSQTVVHFCNTFGGEFMFKGILLTAVQINSIVDGQVWQRTSDYTNMGAPFMGEWGNIWKNHFGKHV